MYKRCIHNQINDCFHLLFPKVQCRFRKGFNAQHCLLVLVWICHEILDKRDYAGILLTDLSKAFDCINHKLLIAKLHAYGLSLELLTFIESCLSYQIQRVKINSFFSEYGNIESSAPQWTISGPRFLNIFICGLFFDTSILQIMQMARFHMPMVLKWKSN